MPSEIFNERAFARWVIKKGMFRIDLEKGFRHSNGKFAPCYVTALREIVADVQMRTQVLTWCTFVAGEVVDAIASVHSGATAMASMLAQSLGAPLLLVYPEPKVHGLQNPIIGSDIYPPNGKFVPLIEDSATTGGSAVKALRHLLDAGATTDTLMVGFAYYPERLRKLMGGHGVHTHIRLSYSVLREEAEGCGGYTPQQLRDADSWWKDPDAWSESFAAKTAMLTDSRR